MGLIGKVAAAVVLLVAVVAVGWYLGVFAPPSATVQDVGDWGAVGEDRTEIETTVETNNPNPVGVAVDSSLAFEYAIRLNGVRVGEGSREGLSVPQGRDRKTITTELVHDRLPAWWVEYVRANETVEASVAVTATVRTGLTGSATVEQNRTMMADSAPMIEAMSAAASNAEGRYPEGPATLYEVRRGWATWGPVNESRTVVLFHFLVHNPSPSPVPAAPDGVRATVEANGIELLATDPEEFALENVDREDVIAPGETREVVARVVMDNQKVDDWFASHVENGERTDLRTSFQVVMQNPATGDPVAVPADPVAYTCRFRTAILVDNQSAGTDCASGGGVGGPGASVRADAPSAVDAPPRIDARPRPWPRPRPRLRP